MHRSQRMINLIRYNYANNWFDIGGGLAMYFTLVSGYNRYGAWGLTDDLRDPDRNYKMEAVRNLQAIPGLEENGIKNTPALIFPNPARDQISIITGSTECVYVKITDLSGKAVFSTSLYIPGTPINLNLLSEGIYFVSLQNKDWTASGKIIISR